MKLVIDISEEYYKTIKETKKEVVPIGWVSIQDGIKYEERAHGEWISKAIHNCWTRFECSVCGYYHKPVHDFGESKPDFNFCPNCGADMRKEGDEE